jgi:hypothetical protein
MFRSKSAVLQDVNIRLFYLKNLDRIAAAFHEKNPNAAIAVSTLVARWPMDTDDQFNMADGHVWWMTEGHLTHTDAARLLNRFDGLIRRYVAERGFVLVDMAQIFEPLDRQRLFYSFPHLTNEGYETMARNYYEELRRAHLIHGTELPVK